MTTPTDERPETHIHLTLEEVLEYCPEFERVMRRTLRRTLVKYLVIWPLSVAALLATIAACATTPPVDCSKAMVEYYGCKYEALAPEPQDCFATSEAYYGCRAAAIGGEK